jgi:putative cardiolipin synthase
MRTEPGQAIGLPCLFFYRDLPISTFQFAEGSLMITSKRESAGDRGECPVGPNYENAAAAAGFTHPFGGQALKSRIKTLVQAAVPGQSGFRLLLSGQEAFSARAETIAQATETIDLQYYITHDGISTRLLLDELLQAANRGVRIRLLLDDFASDARDHRVLLSAAHPNIAMKVFNPPRRGRKRAATRTFGRLIELSQQHRRMHNKLLLADRHLVIMGGRNLGDEYFDVDPTCNFVDVDLLCIGPVASQLSDSFDEYWEHSLSVPIEQCLRKPGWWLGRRRESSPLQTELDEAWQNAPVRCAQLTGYRQAPQLSSWLEDLIWANGRAFWDPPGKLATSDMPTEDQLMAAPLLPVALGVRRELIMVSAYFVPTRAGLAYFKGCVDRGVSVWVLTNALEATDVPLVHGGYQIYRAALLRAGVRLFEMRKSPAIRSRYNLAETRTSLHSKAAIFDGRHVFIGPLNFDPRSVLWNSEVGILVDSPALADALSRLVTEGLSKAVSYEVRLDGTARNAGFTWHYEDNQGRPFRLTCEPASLRRRFNAWMARV